SKSPSAQSLCGRPPFCAVVQEFLLLVVGGVANRCGQVVLLGLATGQAQEGPASTERNLPNGDVKALGTRSQKMQRAPTKAALAAPAKAQSRTALGGAPLPGAAKAASTLKTLAGQFGGLARSRHLTHFSCVYSGCCRNPLSGHGLLAVLVLGCG